MRRLGNAQVIDRRQTLHHHTFASLAEDQQLTISLAQTLVAIIDKPSQDQTAQDLFAKLARSQCLRQGIHRCKEREERDAMHESLHILLRAVQAHEDKYSILLLLLGLVRSQRTSRISQFSTVCGLRIRNDTTLDPRS